MTRGRPRADRSGLSRLCGLLLPRRVAEAVRLRAEVSGAALGAVLAGLVEAGLSAGPALELHDRRPRVAVIEELPALADSASLPPPPSMPAPPAPVIEEPAAPPTKSAPVGGWLDRFASRIAEIAATPTTPAAAPPPKSAPPIDPREAELRALYAKIKAMGLRNPLLRASKACDLDAQLERARLYVEQQEALLRETEPERLPSPAASTPPPVEPETPAPTLAPVIALVPAAPAAAPSFVEYLARAREAAGGVLSFDAQRRVAEQHRLDYLRWQIGEGSPDDRRHQLKTAHESRQKRRRA